MMAALRKFSKSWIAALIIGFLIIAFAVWGTGDVFKAGGNVDIVLKAGKQEMTRADFKREFENRKTAVEERAKRPITAEEAVANGMDKQLLSILGAETSIKEVLRKLGIRPSDKLVSQEVAKQRGFYDPITGKFDPRTYQTLLAQNGLTPALYEKSLAAEIAQKHALGAMGFGLRAPKVYGAFQAVYAFQARDVRFFAIDPSKIARPAAPTDAQLSAFLKEHSAQVMKPEFRQLTIVRFSSKALAAGVTADPAEIQRLFDYRKDQLSTPETRTLVQVTVKNQATAATVAARLAKGEDPATVAKAVGGEVLTYDSKPKTAIADTKVADAAFALSAGQVSGPIQGALSFAVVKITAVTPGKTVDLASVRPQLAEEARARAAEKKVADVAAKFEKAYSGGANMAEAAHAVGLVPTNTPPVTAQGATLDGRPVTGLSPKLLETAFKLPEGGDSEVTEDERGEYYIVRVEKVTPPALPSVNEVRGPLTQAYMQSEMQSRMKARADELSARVRKGESIDAVAASIGATAIPILGINRMSAQAEAAKLGAPFIGAILQAKAGEVFVAPAGSGLVVAKLESIKNGDPVLMAQVTDRARDQISSELIEEYRNQIGIAATSAVKLRTFPERAQSALGVEPAAPVDGKSKGKAG